MSSFKEIVNGIYQREFLFLKYFPGKIHSNMQIYRFLKIHIYTFLKHNLSQLNFCEMQSQYFYLAEVCC